MGACVDVSVFSSSKESLNRLVMRGRASEAVKVSVFSSFSESLNREFKVFREPPGLLVFLSSLLLKSH